MKRITDPTFKYVPAASTDIRKTFARIRKQMREEARAREEAAAKVTPIKRSGGASQ